MALMFSQFLSTDGGLQIANVLTISTIFTLNNLVAFSIWAAVGDKIADKFRTDEGAKRLNLLFGTILAAVAVWMFLHKWTQSNSTRTHAQFGSLSALSN